MGKRDINANNMIDEFFSRDRDREVSIPPSTPVSTDRLIDQSTDESTNQLDNTTVGQSEDELTEQLNAVPTVDLSNILPKPSGFYLTSYQDKALDRLVERLKTKLKTDKDTDVNRSVVARLIFERAQLNTKHLVDELAELYKNHLKAHYGIE